MSLTQKTLLIQNAKQTDLQKKVDYCLDAYTFRFERSLNRQLRNKEKCSVANISRRIKNK